MDETQVRSEVVALLQGRQAHVDLNSALKDFPAEKRGQRPHGLPYSAWQLLEHIRFTQQDILDWTLNSDGTYEEHKWPEDYWVKDPEPASAEAWENSIAAVGAGQKQMTKLVEGGDLTAKLPWSKGHTLLREAMLLADHNAYHTAEIVLLRRLLNCWK